LTNLHGLTVPALEQHLLGAGFKKFNATQVYEWTYQKRAKDFESMSNLSKDLRDYLSRGFSVPKLEVAFKQQSSDGTVKYLFKLEDGYLIETVLMRHEYGLSLCVTSQVGCNMGCSFCASGLRKKSRDITAAELVEQVLGVEQDIDQRISHLVVMGIGEPFDNYENVMDFIRIVNHAKGLAIGARHITVSTSGLVPKILQFADEPIRVNLAVSLHAPNDELRTKLMKINKAYPIDELLDALKRYFAKTSRRITFEYILLSNVNDSIELADQLSDKIRGLNAYVNLIPYNPVKEFAYEPTDMARASKFYDRLMKRGIAVTLRREQGKDIDAACGQLRMNREQKVD
jgi:23S rRNA (adenine2503-C2)-methyltransferase